MFRKPLLSPWEPVLQFGALSTSWREMTVPVRKRSVHEEATAEHENNEIDSQQTMYSPMYLSIQNSPIY